MSREVHIEQLLGRHVYDSKGESIGRIEEVIAEEQGDEYVVREYLVGNAALLHRLSAVDIGRSLLGLFRAKEGGGYRVPWDKLDLTNPEKLRLQCHPHELETITDRLQKKDRKKEDHKGNK